jgi:hypothetical protein
MGKAVGSTGTPVWFCYGGCRDSSQEREIRKGTPIEEATGVFVGTGKGV